MCDEEDIGSSDAEDIGSCDAEDIGSSACDDGDDEGINVRYQFGSIVVAKLATYPWWPAMVDPCPDTNDIYWLEDNQNLSKHSASHYHVVFFDVPGKVSRSWVLANRITPYKMHFPNPLSQEDRDRVKNLKANSSRKRRVEARRIAEIALRMPIEERKKTFSFIYTFKGLITLFDEDGNKQVIDGGKAGDGVTAQMVETPKIRKTQGLKPKIKTTVVDTERKVKPLRISITLKPGSKQNKHRQALSGSETGGKSGKRAYSIRSRSSQSPETKDKSEKRAYSLRSRPSKPSDSNCTVHTRRSSVASSSSSVLADSTSPTKARRARHSARTPSISPPSSVPRASNELAEELSVFAASFPVEDTLSEENMPKKRGRRKKRKGKTSQASQKRARLRKNLAPQEILASCDTEVVSDTSTRACSPETVVLENAVSSSSAVITCLSPSASLPLEPPEELAVDTQSKQLALADLAGAEPTENSLGNQMALFLNRIQKQTPKLKCTGKTISNLNHLVAKTEEEGVIDLTCDDDEDCTLRHGEVVFANLKGLQPWPAVVVMDPEINICFIPNTGRPNYVHVFFLRLNRRAWVPIENVTIFEDNKLHTKEVEMLNYDKYRSAYDLARKAILFTREQRALQYSDMQSVPMTGAPVARDDISDKFSALQWDEPQHREEQEGTN